MKYLTIEKIELELRKNQKKVEEKYVILNLLLIKLKSGLSTSIYLIQRELALKKKQIERAKRLEELIEQNRQYEQERKNIKDKKQEELRERIEERRIEREQQLYVLRFFNS